jgi:hypothetical protein
VRWARGNGLAVNASKTQFLLSSNRGYCNNITVNVDGKAIAAKAKFDLLGVTYNRKLGTDPHNVRVAAAVKQRAGLIARLSHHLPRGRYLRQLAAGLLLGKINHALAAVAYPRLVAADGGANISYKAMQISLNDVCRTVTGRSRREHVTVESLHDKARLPGINAMVTKAVAVETWKAHVSRDGDDGTRNPIGEIVFNSAAVRTSRATTAGLAKVPLRGYSTMVTAAATIINACPALRAARSLAEARTAAEQLARGLPL